MAEPIDVKPDDERQLVLARLIAAPVTSVYRCWTEADLLCQWFAPAPNSVSKAELDVRPGGTGLVVMRSPDGQEFPAPGVYLTVEPNRRLVMTDAYVTAWVPSEKPFVTIDLSFEAAGEDGQSTHYVARLHHWSVEDRDAHLEMGFESGWNTTTEQLEQVAQSLKG